MSLMMNKPLNCFRNWLTSFGQASKSLFKNSNVGPKEQSSSVEGGTRESSSSGCHQGSSGTGTVVHRGWARPYIMSRSRLRPSVRERHVRATRVWHHQHRFNCEASWKRPGHSKSRHGARKAKRLSKVMSERDIQGLFYSESEREHFELEFFFVSEQFVRSWAEQSCERA